jgi:hypothetical protein
MRDALYLLAAFAATYLAFACFALTQPQHWRAVTAAAGCAPLGKVFLKIAGIAGLASGLAIALWREGPDYGALLWVTELTVAAASVVATLSFKPTLLKPLAALPARA